MRSKQTVLEKMKEPLYFGESKKKHSIYESNDVSSWKEDLTMRPHYNDMDIISKQHSKPLTRNSTLP
jgi:hypothetical protein